MSLLLALVLAAPAAEAFTATADVRACQPLADGRVLAATSGGLVLYGPDLEPERAWTSLDGLPGTDARALAVSKDGGTVWVGASEGVAALQRGGTGRWELRPLARLRSVGALLPRDDGRLVVGAAGAVVVLDAQRGTEQGRSTLPGGRALVLGLAAGPRGVHVGTSGAGLWTWDGAALRAEASLPSPFVHTVASDGPRVLAGTVGGLVQLGRPTAVSHAEVRALLRLDGGWLAGTMGEGLRRLDDATGREEPVAFPSAHVTALGRHGDTVCAGTNQGAFVRRGAAGAWRRASVTGPPSNDVSALAVDGERLWVGTFDRGLARLDGGRWTTVAGLDDRINAIAVERAGSRVWVACSRGLATVVEGAVHVRRVADGLPADDVHAVAVLRSGGVVAGTARGAAIVRGGRVESLVKSGAPAEATWAVAESEDGSLWLGTTNGLYRYRRGAPVERFSVAGGHLWDNWVTSIAFEGPTVWVGTYAGGASAVRFGVRNAAAVPWAGPAHVNPAGLSVAGGRLWAATMEGLLSLPLSGGDVWREAEGAALGRDVTAVAEDGRVRWVASRNGLARQPIDR